MNNLKDWFAYPQSTPPKCKRIEFRDQFPGVDRETFYRGMYSPSGDWYAIDIAPPIKNVRYWRFVAQSDLDEYERKRKEEKKKLSWWKRLFK